MLANLMTSSSGDDVITKLFEIVANHVQTIIFKTWGLKLLYLLWFRRENDYKSRCFGNDCIYLSSNPKTTRVTAIRIFITPRKGLKVFKPVSSFYKNICDRVRESESKMMKHEKIDNSQYCTSVTNFANFCPPPGPWLIEDCDLQYIIFECVMS